MRTTNVRAPAQPFSLRERSASFSVVFGSSLERIAREISPKSIFSGIED
jgi:hypothetical protein